MYRLRVRFPSLKPSIKNTPDRLHRLYNRLEALALTFPPGEVPLYYPRNFHSLHRVLPHLGGVVPVEGPVGDDDFAIEVGHPDILEGDLFKASGYRANFHESRAVLTLVEGDRETVLWDKPCREWIFFAYPDELVMPFRQGGQSLQRILIPRIEAGSSRMLERLKIFLKDPQEPEGVHQYRVSIRSFRALISMVKPLLDEGKYRAIQQHFRSLAHDAALLRELDVIMEEYLLAGAEDGAFLAALRADRRREEERLVAALNHGKGRRLLRRGVNLFLEALSQSSWKEVDGLYFVDMRLHNWYRFTLESLWELDRFDFPFVHRIRIKSKKYRYITEFFQELMTETQLNQHKMAKKRQKRLGEICDALRNQEAIDEMLSAFGPAASTEALAFQERESQREEEILMDLGLKEAATSPEPQEPAREGELPPLEAEPMEVARPQEIRQKSLEPQTAAPLTKKIKALPTEDGGDEVKKEVRGIRSLFVGGAVVLGMAVAAIKRFFRR
ncbi:MAG: CHAD domain-containing protein [Tissierellia bacterium]|nr:CHAD domain-containing protein [Tissierellia bacterium]